MRVLWVIACSELSISDYISPTHATELLQLHDLQSAVAERPAQAPMRPDAHDSTRPVAIEPTLPSSGMDSSAPIVVSDV